MKVWLAHRTPNTYNGADNKNVYYKGKLGLAYEQGKSESTRTVYTHGSASIGEIMTGNYVDDPSELTGNIPNTLYLKHVLNYSNVVLKSYVCYVMNNTEYCLQGEKTEDENHQTHPSQYYQSNIYVIASLGQVSCTTNDEECIFSHFNAYRNGRVWISPAESYDCSVDSDGSSSCYYSGIGGAGA